VAWASRPCHNASPTAHADSTESRDLTLAKKLDNGRIEAPTRETPFRRHAGQATLPRQVRLKRVAAAPRRYADTPTRRHAHTPIRPYADTPIRRHVSPTPTRPYADTFSPRCKHAQREKGDRRNYKKDGGSQQEQQLSSKRFRLTAGLHMVAPKNHE
jgi:hypothetical protein